MRCEHFPAVLRKIAFRLRHCLQRRTPPGGARTSNGKEDSMLIVVIGSILFGD
ncbi:MAG: hypothetical protein K6E40_11045 [Desulfovibrio sp.]|nr:hypothetical protein [Desulfovibrio sp.]